jgi:hypothetical protein
MAMNRNLPRRLEQFEERMIPSTVRKVWQIITMNSDGTTEPTGISIEWPANPTLERRQGTLQRCVERRDETAR